MDHNRWGGMMNRIIGLIVCLIFAVVLSMVVGFVIASIKGYEFAFTQAVPFGLLLGAIVFVFSQLIPTEKSA